MRLTVLGLGLAVALVSAGCVETFRRDPYGWQDNSYLQQQPPRYGHGGTQSPAAAPGGTVYQTPGPVPPSQYSQTRSETVFLPEAPAPATRRGNETPAPPSGSQPVGPSTPSPGSPPTSGAATGAAGGGGETPSPAPSSPANDLPVAKRVPGQPNYVYSPFEKDRMVDVEQIPSGTEVKCPYTQKHFLVP